LLSVASPRAWAKVLVCRGVWRIGRVRMLSARKALRRPSDEGIVALVCLYGEQLRGVGEVNRDESPQSVAVRPPEKLTGPNFCRSEAMESLVTLHVTWLGLLGGGFFNFNPTFEERELHPCRPRVFIVHQHCRPVRQWQKQYRSSHLWPLWYRTSCARQIAFLGFIPEPGNQSKPA
jgi:hypothetical protein